MPDLSPTDVAMAAATRLLPAERGHLLWTGKLRAGCPWIYLHYTNRNVRRAWWQAQGHPLARQDLLHNRCGNPRCVAPAHQRREEREAHTAHPRRVGPRPGGDYIAHAPLVPVSELYDLDPFDHVPWPKPPRPEPRPCIVCGQATPTRPGTVPMCVACADAQPAAERLCAQARRGV